jgi:Protein of unknown function (DUF2924)
MVLILWGRVKMLSSYITDRVDSLCHLTKPELSGLWRQLLKRDPPLGMRKDLLLRVVAQQSQEQEFGGLTAASCRHLSRLAATVESNPAAVVSNRSPIKSGTRMVRQWKDQVHVVNVEGKQFEYRGDRYESLSEIARLITGTQWSGPLFFGLKGRQSNTSKEAQ